MTRALVLSVFLALSLGVIAAFIAPRPVSAQQVLAPNPEIEAVIGGQLDAFRDADLPRAWGFASPMIQDMFGGVERFGQMVQQGYPMVWNPGAVAFIDLQTFGGLTVQRVEIVDQAGVAHYLGYSMTQTADGWRISGVQILPAPDVAA